MAQANMTTAEHHEAGAAILDYMKEQLAEHGDSAKLSLHADQIRSLLTATTTPD